METILLCQLHFSVLCVNYLPFVIYSFRVAFHCNLVFKRRTHVLKLRNAYDGFLSIYFVLVNFDEEHIFISTRIMIFTCMVEINNLGVCKYLKYIFLFFSYSFY
jgi:hypothetical protein